MTGHRRSVRPPWLLAGLLIMVLAALLVTAGFADAQVGVINAQARSQGVHDQVPSAVLNGGPVVDARRRPVTSGGAPDHTVALSFDDGPDPSWTPEVLAVLRKYGVPGTFFVIGSNAARHPDLIRQIHDSGSEIGLHTFTHPDLATISSWQFDRELAETQFTLAGAAGISSDLLRPPYSSSSADLDNISYQVVLGAGRRGYVTAFADVDSEDWRRPGVSAIVRNATPEEGQGAIILMHDAGGDRSETVAALDRLIPLLRGEGYRFTTVTGAVGLPWANPPVGSRTRITGGVLLAVTGVSLRLVAAIQWLLLGVGGLVIARLVLMVAMARRHARRHRRPGGAGWTAGPPVTEPVSVIVPAYNEQANIEATLRSILRNTHPLEVLVVDDGSTDDTAAIVERLALPGVRLIRQANGGKASALNAGIAAARHDIVVMMDGDTIFEPDTVHRLVRPFADPGVGAVSGNVKVANRDSLLGRLQHIEYVMGFNVDRRVHDLLGSMPTIPGAAGAFRRQALLEVGGLSDDTLAEDTDLTIALGRAGWRSVYEDSAIAWTEVPGTLRQLWQQRYRWTYGTMQAVWKHRRAVTDSGASGRLGRRGLLQVAVFQMILPLSAPVIDVFFCYGLFFLNITTTALVWIAILAVQLLMAAVAFRWDHEPLSTLWVLPLQQVVYRQLMYVVLVQSVVTAVSGRRVRWQKLRRVGVFNTPQPIAPLPVAASAVVRHADATPRRPVAPLALPAPVPRAKAQALPPSAAARSARTVAWLALLAAFALLDVIAYHLLGIGWLTLLPGNGVLFAVGGALIGRSMSRMPTVDTIGRWLRRLLVPTWLLGAILIPVMFWHGWLHESGDNALRPAQLLLWAFPVLDPPTSSWAADATSAVWLVRVALWLIVLTPLLNRALQRHPVWTCASPIALVVADQLLGDPLARSGSLGSALLDAATLGTCWLLGLACWHGILARLRPLLGVGLALGMIAVGGLWTARHLALRGDYDLSDLPMGEALISSGFTLLLLRFPLRAPFLAAAARRAGRTDRILSIIGHRALSVYLWHNIAIDLSVPITAALGWTAQPAQVGVVLGLIVAAALLFGWAEDIGARRPVGFVRPRAPRRTPAPGRR